MSIPGPPPGMSARTPGSAAYRTWSSAPNPPTYHQQILGDLADRLGGNVSRWHAVLMLRVLRLKQDRFHVSQSDFAPLAPRPFSLFMGTPWVATMCQAVYSRGRLSEVGIRLGCSSIAADPLHIDIDWFGDEPLPAWWNPAIAAGDAERTATVGLLHFLEESLGLAKSVADPASWSWPAGTNRRAPWAENVVKSIAPPIQAGFEALLLEWHEGESSTFATGSSGATFWFSTPKAGSSDTV